MPVRLFCVFCLLSALLNYSLFASSGNILIISYNFCVVSISYYSLIYVIYLSLFIASAASLESLITSVCCFQVTESSYVSLFGLLRSYSYDTNKPSVGWPFMFSFSITSSKISSMISNYSFTSFNSWSSLFFMSSMMGIPGVHSKMVYW